VTASEGLCIQIVNPAPLSVEALPPSPASAVDAAAADDAAAAAAAPAAEVAVADVALALPPPAAAASSADDADTVLVMHRVTDPAFLPPICRSAPVLTDRPAVIHVADCGGDAVLDLGRSHWNVHETLTGLLSFHGLQFDITAIDIILYKLETMEGSTAECVILEESVLKPGDANYAPVPASRRPSAAPAPGAAGAPLPPPSAVFSLRLNLSLTDVAPSYPRIASPAAAGAGAAAAAAAAPSKPAATAPADGSAAKPQPPAASVLYYLRLLVVGGPDGRSKYWNTEEVVLHRAAIAGDGSVEP
jgi:hypothetical protein